MKTILAFVYAFLSLSAFGQSAYADSLLEFRKQYIENHEVVRGGDKKFLHFFSPSEQYKVLATVEKTPNSPWFKMETSGLLRPLYRVFGKAHFILNGDSVHLDILQSQSLLLNEQYKNYLFIPFTDLTNGNASYDGGRYLDFTFDDIKNRKLLIDFNKCYNPYCAYVSDKYNCPIPPKENYIPLKIEAGEKAFSKPH